MRITQKGQVTIPQEIREKLGLLPYAESVRQASVAWPFCVMRMVRLLLVNYYSLGI